MKDIIIIGAGGFAKEVIWLIERINMYSKIYNIIGIVDDFYEQESLCDLPILGGIDYIDTIDSNTDICIAIGNGPLRESIVSNISNTNISFPNLIDPSVIMSNKVNLGAGNIICAGCILTVDINIDNFNIINIDTTVGHDVIINDYCTILPSSNISGNVKLSNNVMIGTGTQVIQGVEIKENCIIGAGAVVIRDTDENSTYGGVPSKKLVKK